MQKTLIGGIILAVGVTILGLGVTSYLEYAQCQSTGSAHPGLDTLFFCNIPLGRAEAELGAGVAIAAAGAFVLAIGFKNRSMVSAGRGAQE